MLKAVILPVRGFSDDGTFSIAIDRRAEIGVNLDAMGVAGQRRIGPDFQPRLVGSDAGEAERGRNIDIGREPARALTRRAVKHFLRRDEILHRNLMLDQIRRALKPARRLARDHGDGADIAFGGGTHGIEAKERAGRHQNARALRLGEIHEIPVVEKLADAERHENPAAHDHQFRERTEHFRRQTFDNNVTVLRQRLWRNDRDAIACIRQITPRLVMIARRYCGKR